MKFSIAKSAFIQEVNDVSRAISGKTAIPILSGIHIQVNTDEGIFLIGSDSNLSIKSYLESSDAAYELKIEEKGSIVVNATLFQAIIRKMPDDHIHFETNADETVLIIKSGDAVFNINGQPGSSYPYLPALDDSHPIHLPAQRFKELIDHTIFSASNQENRPALTGLNLTLHPDHICGVATDSHRLSRREMPVEINLNSIQETNFTIPKKTVVELSRIIQDDADLEMLLSEKQVIFRYEHLIIFSRLLEGVYPDTDRLIPQEASTEFIVNANLFQQALERSSLMAQGNRSHTAQLTMQDGEVELSVEHSERGKLRELVPVIQFTGEPLLISFNPDFMSEALKSFGGIDVCIRFQSAIRPILITAQKPSELAHNDLLQLLTPIRTHQTM